MNDNVHEHGNCNLCRRQGCAQIAALSQDVIRATGIALSLENKIAALEAERNSAIAAFREKVQDFADEISRHRGTGARVTALEAERLALHRERKGEVWYWQGDGYDFPESLCCPVLIEPEKLRAFVAALAPFVALAKAAQAVVKAHDCPSVMCDPGTGDLEERLAHPAVQRAVKDT